MAQDISSQRLERLLKLMNIFISNESISKKDLCDKLEYTNPNLDSNSKALQRDLFFLREYLQFNVVYNRKKCKYFLNEKADFVVNCPLSEDEFITLVAGINLAGHFIPYLSQSSKGLRNKITNLIPEKSRPKGETLALSSTVNLPVSKMDSHIFRMIVDAIHDKKVLKIQYRSPYGKEKKIRTHLLSPWFIFFRYRAWYLWGKSNNYTQAGTFRISRIILAEPVEAIFEEKPGGLDISNFAFNDNPIEGEAIRVELEIFEPFASSVEDVPDWYPCQKVKRTREGDAIYYSAVVKDLTDISRWILSAADCMKIISPDSLKHLVRKKAETLLSRM